MPRPRFLVPTLSLAAAALAASEAQDPPVSAPAPVTADNAVIVTATRLGAPPAQQPFSLHRHDAAELRQENTRTALDAVNLTPGVQVQRTAPN